MIIAIRAAEDPRFTIQVDMSVSPLKGGVEMFRDMGQVRQNALTVEAKTVANRLLVAPDVAGISVVEASTKGFAFTVLQAHNGDLGHYLKVLLDVLARAYVEWVDVFAVISGEFAVSAEVLQILESLCPDLHHSECVLTF